MSEELLKFFLAIFIFFFIQKNFLYLHAGTIAKNTAYLEIQKILTDREKNNNITQEKREELVEQALNIIQTLIDKKLQLFLQDEEFKQAIKNILLEILS